MRRTKIVASLGPACANARILRRMVAAGLDVARINLSHGTHAEHRKTIRLLRAAAAERKKPVAILFDLSGPKMRIGQLRGGGPVQLGRGDPFCITTRTILGDARGVSTTYSHLPRDVSTGDAILLDDGRIQLEVTSIKGEKVHCKVAHAGLLGEHKGINLPGVTLSAPALTKKDFADLAFAKSMRADYVALSFVRSRQDVRQLRTWLKNNALMIPIIAKIERAEALENLEEILEEADGVMVARGDLGVECSVARVPVLQKNIIGRANRSGRLVITATQMLESMIENPVPTRAEASDIANAIFDHTDAVMLSGETASGKFPVQAVQTMDAIIREAEHSTYVRTSRVKQPIKIGHSVTQAVVQAASHAAEAPEVEAILLFTMTGTTAQVLSKQRPPKVVYALTADPKVVRRMALYWGVVPYLVKVGHTTDQMIDRAEQFLVRKKLLKKGDLVVTVAGTIRLKGATNMMKFLKI